MSIKDLFSMVVPRGKVGMTWFNDYSGIVFRTPTSTLIFDPIGIEISDIPFADGIIVTHEHFDHFEAKLVQNMQKQMNSMIVTTPYVSRQLKGIPSDKLKALKIGESTIIGKVKLDAEYSDHPGNQPLTFMITTDDGIKIYHSSDSRPYSEMKKLGERYKPDIALCTVGIAPGASPKSGVEIAKLIRPKIAIPYHTDRMKSLEEFTEILKKEALEIKSKIIEQLEIYQYPE